MDICCSRSLAPMEVPLQAVLCCSEPSRVVCEIAAAVGEVEKFSTFQRVQKLDLNPKVGIHPAWPVGSVKETPKMWATGQGVSMGGGGRTRLRHQSIGPANLSCLWHLLRDEHRRRLMDVLTIFFEDPLDPSFVRGIAECVDGCRGVLAVVSFACSPPLFAFAHCCRCLLFVFGFQSYPESASL